MERLGEVWRRLLCLVRRGQLDRELAEEMRFHLDMKAAEQGELAARRQFGNELLLREDSRDEDLHTLQSVSIERPSQPRKAANTIAPTTVRTEMKGRKIVFLCRVMK